MDVAKFRADEDEIDEEEKDSLHDLTGIVNMDAQDSDKEVNFSS